MSLMNRIRWTRRASKALSLAVVSLLLSACDSVPKDETAGMSVEKLYSEAREEASAGNYERALKLYERLEGRAAGTLLSQQAQLERAYMSFRTGEKAQALAIVERFIKDLGMLVKEQALKAVAVSRAAGTDQFEAGRAMAWYEVVSLIQQQAAAFGLSPSHCGLGGFDAERDLLTKPGANRGAV